MQKRTIALGIILVSMLVIPSLSTTTLTVTNKQVVSATDVVPVTITTSTVIAEAGGPYIGTKCNSILFTGSAVDGCIPYTWDWDFGDGSIHSNQQNITHQYVNDGSYIATLTVTDCVGGIDSDTASITISTPVLVADANGPYDGFTGIPINFYGSANGGCPRVGCKPYNYSWNFGDGGGSTKQNPMHTYVSSGEYTVILSVTDDKNDTSINITSATILGSDLDVDAGGPYYGEVDVPIQFYGDAENGMSPYSFYWSFGDNSTSIEQNPRHIYSEPNPSSRYKVILYVSDSSGKNGWSQTSAYVSGNIKEPTANANGPYEGIVNESIQFSGSAFGGTSPYTFSWDFDDTNGIQTDSTLQNPTYKYEKTGINNVTLIVTDRNGKTDEDKTTATITEKTIDIIPPIVKIIKPVNGIYIGNKLILPLNITFIIGKIDVEVSAYDNISGIRRVEFFLNGRLWCSYSSPPFIWTWNEKRFGKNTLKVVAYDFAGNNASVEMMIWKFF